MRFFSMMTIAAMMALAGCDSRTPEEVEADACDSKGAAFYIAKGFIKDALRSPSTAVFASYSDGGVTVQRIDKVACRHLVSGYVDSQNGFGATIRSQYRITVEKAHGVDSWRAAGLEIR